MTIVSTEIVPGEIIHDLIYCLNGLLSNFSVVLTI